MKVISNPWIEIQKVGSNQWDFSGYLTGYIGDYQSEISYIENFCNFLANIEISPNIYERYYLRHDPQTIIRQKFVTLSNKTTTNTIPQGFFQI